MRSSRSFFIAALVLYLVFGIVYQVWTCATWTTNLGQDGYPPDIPCAGVPWTIFIVSLWPGYSSLDLWYGHPMAGALFVAAFLVVLVLFALGLRKRKRA